MRTTGLAIFGAAALSAVVIASPASAVTNFTTNFDSYGVDTGAWGATGGGGWDVLPHIEYWTATDGPGIEVQNHVAGSPQSGPNHVELDSHANSTMSRLIDAGKYTLTFYYSGRPGVGADSNGIDVLLNGSSIFHISDGNSTGDTIWSKQTVSFSAKDYDMLSFAATGKNDSYGGYIDTVNLNGVGGVPEPASWAMLMAGFGIVGSAMRRRNPRAALA
jgi:hypothetical protein